MVETTKIHTEFPEHRWLIADIDALNIANGKLNEPFSSVGPATEVQQSHFPTL